MSVCLKVELNAVLVWHLSALNQQGVNKMKQGIQTLMHQRVGAFTETTFVLYPTLAYFRNK